jgi:hypothetical protein
MPPTSSLRRIVQGANPPMYKNWLKLVLPMLEGSIAAAKESGARFLFPGSIYNFLADGPMVLREDTPQRATTRKGRSGSPWSGGSKRRDRKVGAV